MDLTEGLNLSDIRMLESNPVWKRFTRCVRARYVVARKGLADTTASDSDIRIVQGHAQAYEYMYRFVEQLRKYKEAELKDKEDREEQEHA